MLASSESHANRRIRGAAAGIGGTAGMLLGGPVSSAVAGMAAAYATSREDVVGTVARWAGGVYLHVQDLAIDKGMLIMDKAVKEGRTALPEQVSRASPRHLPAVRLL